jgi:hypothetical protein
VARNLRLYVVAGLIVLVASSFVWVMADDDVSTVLTIAGVMFWASGLALTVIGLSVLRRRLGPGSATPDANVDNPPGSGQEAEEPDSR